MTNQPNLGELGPPLHIGITDGDGAVLLLRDSHGDQEWDIPYTFLDMEKPETIEQAAERGAREELGVHIEVQEDKGSLSVPDKGKLYFSHLVVARIVAGRARVQRLDRHDEVAYHTPRRIARLGDYLRPRARQLIDKILPEK